MVPLPSVRVFAAWVFVVGGVVGGCNEVTEEPAITSVKIIVTDGWQEDAPLLEGVRVCQMDTDDNCMFTDARGEATLMLPRGVPTGVTRDKEGYGPRLSELWANGPEFVMRLGMSRVQREAEKHDGVGSPYPMRGTGTILLEVSPAFAGATFELLGATGERFYHDEGAPTTWNPERTATTSRGQGGFTEVTPGEVQVKFGGTAERCAAQVPAWAGDEPNSARVQVREGYISSRTMNCWPP